MQIRFLTSVSLGNMQPQTTTVLTVVAGWDAPDVVTEATDYAYVTSVTRIHDDDSLHQVGKAVDFDLLTYQANQALADALEYALTRDYDVLHHADSDGDGTHVHVEYQPQDR